MKSKQKSYDKKLWNIEAVVVAQLIEQSFPIPEVCSSNPVIGKNLYWTFTVNCIEKMKIKKNMPGMANFLKKTL